MGMGAVTQIPLNVPAHLSRANQTRGKWMNHIRKKQPARPPRAPGIAASPLSQSASSDGAAYGSADGAAYEPADGAAYASADGGAYPGADGGAYPYPPAPSFVFAPDAEFTLSPVVAHAPPHTLGFNTGLDSLAGDALPGQAYAFPGSGAVHGVLGAGTGAVGNAIGMDELLAFFGAGADAFGEPGLVPPGEYTAPTGMPGVVSGM
jgi:hypothetical protein